MMPIALEALTQFVRVALRRQRRASALRNAETIIVRKYFGTDGIRGRANGVITPDLAAVSVVYILLGAAAIWLLDRLVGLEIFLRSR